jgi:N-hydroxyarylamine O-acetyltransferase
MSFDLPAYLSRIALPASAPSPEALCDLQAAQLRAIPFENTGPLLGIVPDLDDAAVWRRLVLEGRGGYCLELNRLLARALEASGYRVEPILARVRMGAPAGGPRAHLAQLVHVGGRSYLVDAGFGGPAPERPIPLGGAEPVVDRLGTFRLREDRAAGETVLERATPDGWFALYGFDRVPVRAPDHVAANFFCAAFPGSPFTSHLMANRVTADGRVSLFDLTLTAPSGARRIVDAEDLADVLRSLFGLPGADIAPRLWRRLTSARAA